jgi:hypothetical protein
LNDYYRYDLVEELNLPGVRSDWTQEATVDDNGEYPVSEEVLAVEEPFTANGGLLETYYDKEKFFEDYPEDEDYITAPGLAIGTTSAAAVKNSAFKYKVGSWIYAKAAGETALSGDTVPQNKYGAWVLEIDEDGAITVSEASDNATGYATAALALNDLPSPTADTAWMGFVTAISTDSGGFVPGTTELSASAVTDTYTDGRMALRAAPVAVLLDLSAGKIYIRPKVNDTFLLKSKLTLQRPTALSLVGDTPLDTKWGLAIALGAAIKYIAAEEFDADKIAKLRGDPPFYGPGTLKYELNSIRKKRWRQIKNRPVERAF